MSYLLSFLFALCVIAITVSVGDAFTSGNMRSYLTRRTTKSQITPSRSSISMSLPSFATMPSGFDSFASSLSLLLADTSISEEEVLDVTGRASDLPDPLVAVGFGVFVFLGVAVLQFSLGDLTKEEGQARVRDFLQTKRDTERKRGYFD